MFVGEADRIARSVALEKTYVHDVYNQMSALRYPGQRNGHRWPKVNRFINELEPGSTVCDVGCGSGKYLRVNSGVYKVGVDICKQLTQVAKDEDKEVILCDNLTLPFRDESFDAVLSIAVIHHFATRERRICALKELARILRVGGRLIITVWAMEQKYRKYETQDVLVPCYQPQYLQSSSLEVSTSATATSEEDFAAPIRVPLQSSEVDYFYPRSSSLKQEEKKEKPHLQLFRSLRSIKTSPSSSTLSSPNETCYSFVRKALQKLSRSNKRDKHESGTWFIESLTSLSKYDHISATRYEPEGCEQDEDIQNIPIEIIRMEKELEQSQTEKPTAYKQLLEVLHLPQKSRSMNDIPQLEVAPVARSRSSVSSLEVPKILSKPAPLDKLHVDTLKPKLVKQKKSLCEECIEDVEEQQKAGLEIEITQTEIPPAEISPGKQEKFNVLKQKSLTEEIMSADRIKEKEQVRQNIQKQASLNEDLIYRRHKTSLDSIKDTLFSTSTAKKFQLFRSGLTSKIKSSTTNIEKVTGSSIKSGFARIFQNLTGGDNAAAAASGTQQDETLKTVRKSSSEDRGDDFLDERRCSHEENSDSSKDNSLQSDTSVDSEDSVISVIERVILKPDQVCSPTKCPSATSPGPHSPKIMQHSLTGVLSHPSSPKIAQSLQYQNSKGKALSLPASPRNLVMSPNIKQTFKMPPVAQTFPNHKMLTAKISANGASFTYEKSTTMPNEANLKPKQEEEIPLLKLSPMEAITGSKLKVFTDQDMQLLSHKLTLLSEKEITVTETEPRGDVCEGDESEKSDVEPDVTTKKSDEAKQSAEGNAHYKIGNLPRSVYALIKRSTVGPGTYTGHTARLPSYELFNPETEDIETDSSGVSTPDSVGSVISVKMDDSELRFEDRAQHDPKEEPVTNDICSLVTTTESEPTDKLPEDIPCEKAIPVYSETTPDSKPVTSTHVDIQTRKEISKTELETQVECTLTADDLQTCSSERLVEQIITESKADVPLKLKLDFVEQTPSVTKSDKMVTTQEEIQPAERPLLKHPFLAKSPTDEMWGNECRQYLVEFAENLSGKLLAEIDRYKEQNINIETKEPLLSPVFDVSDDPYLTKLSEELHHVSKLTKELSQDYDTKPILVVKQESLKLQTLQTSDESNISEETIEITQHNGGELDETEDEESCAGKDEKVFGTLISESSTEIESPGSVSGWLDSRRNTIESNLSKEPALSTTTTTAIEDIEKGKLEEPKLRLDIHEEAEITRRRSSASLIPELIRKLSKSDSIHVSLQARTSIESTDTADISDKTGSSEESASKIKTETSSRYSLESDISVLDRSSDTSKSTELKHEISGSRSSQVSLRPGESVESSDTYDISDRTGSVSDFSRQNTESRSVITQSSASLTSWSDCSKDIRFADRRMARCDGRSSSEETNPPHGAILTRQKAATKEQLEKKEGSVDVSLSGSTSQDSLTSESGGGSVTVHCYYHVFREGELDQLIDEYVENLHIISSYYDHSNWCVIAEKVQVWTI